MIFRHCFHMTISFCLSKSKGGEGGARSFILWVCIWIWHCWVSAQHSYHCARSYWGNIWTLSRKFYKLLCDFSSCYNYYWVVFLIIIQSFLLPCVWSDFLILDIWLEGGNQRGSVCIAMRLTAFLCRKQKSNCMINEHHGFQEYGTILLVS